MNVANKVWQETLVRTYKEPHFISFPRGMEVHERLGDGYGPIPMPAFIDLEERNVNKKFMHREAAWIIEGSNRLSDLTEAMKSYAQFSDDGVTLAGAYGPKVVDQLKYVVDSIEKDRDTRQAVINIWRERPAPSKDIPCTLSMQFLMRTDEKNRVRLNSVVTMRSNDIVLGYTYDVYSFSMVANAVRLLLLERGIQVDFDEYGKFGDLYVNPGSLHIYGRHYDAVEQWSKATKTDYSIEEGVLRVMRADSYIDLIDKLKKEAKVE